MQHADFDQIIAEIVKRSVDCLHTALHIRLHQNGEFDHIALHIVEHRVEAGRRKRGAFLGRFFAAIFGNFAGALLVFNHGQHIARRWHPAQAKHFDRHRWTSLFDLLASIIDNRANFAAFCADNERIAAFQSAARDQHSGDRAAALIELSLDHDSFGITVRARFQLKQFSLKRDFLEQIIKPITFQCRDFHVLHLARQAFDDHFMLKQAVAHIVCIGLWLIHLIDRNDHRAASRFGVLNRLDCLRHDPVIGGHNKHDNIGHIRAALTHFGEGCVARRIKESDFLLILGRDLIATDMLRDAAGLAFNHIGAAQSVEQTGFAVIDMAHNGDDRRTRFLRLFWINIFAGLNINVSL